MSKHDVEYQNNTIEKPVSDLALKLVKYIPAGSVIIDLGAGAGVDSIYFAELGHEVIAIDRETSVINGMINKSGFMYSEKIKVINGDFYQINLPKSDVLYANYSIPFCMSSQFNVNWTKVESQVDVGSTIAVVFFGFNDDWKNSTDRFSFHSLDDIHNLLKNYKIIDMEEKEFDGKSMRPSGEIINKHWHVFEVIAKKKF